jgi:hypothetical protein
VYGGPDGAAALLLLLVKVTKGFATREKCKDSAGLRGFGPGEAVAGVGWLTIRVGGHLRLAERTGGSEVVIFSGFLFQNVSMPRIAEW